MLVSVLIIVFGFFSPRSRRASRPDGSSSHHDFGHDHATLIITCVILVALGWNDTSYAPVALSVGAII